MARNAACPKCRSGIEKEFIEGGITQTVHWNGDYVFSEETTYPKNDDYSTYYCDNKKCPNYGKEI